MAKRCVAKRLKNFRVARISEGIAKVVVNQGKNLIPLDDSHEPFPI
jgi:hypothetical protein